MISKFKIAAGLLLSATALLAADASAQSLSPAEKASCSRVLMRMDSLPYGQRSKVELWNSMRSEARQSSVEQFKTINMLKAGTADDYLTPAEWRSLCSFIGVPLTSEVQLIAGEEEDVMPPADEPQGGSARSGASSGDGSDGGGNGGNGGNGNGSSEDKDKGHGNDPDRSDPDNPGRGPK